jgi:hypothetical protein
VNWRAFGETFVTLFVITDPIGNAPIFVSFQFEKVNIDYHTTKVDGSLGDEIRASFDFLKFVGG